jgi:acetyltransferase-like isoleucine patch superfamily enzyme
MDFFVHPQGLCESKQVGAGTRVWAFAHVLPGAVIGRDVNVCDHVFVENDVIVGDRVTIKCGVQLWDGIRLEDDVFVGPNVSFTNDPFPRSGARPRRFPETRVCRGASIGAGATIMPGLTIGQNAMVAAGSVVTRSVPPNALVMGCPARIRGYVDRHGRVQGDAPHAAPADVREGVQESRVRGVTFHRMPVHRDLRGSLSVGECPRDLPFVPKRYFVVFDVPGSEIRGEHAHRTCHLFLVCVRGACSVVADDGAHREEFRLDRPNLGLHLPPLVWGTQYKHTPDAVLLVFASEPYDPDDYIRDYARFLEEVGSRRS